VGWKINSSEAAHCGRIIKGFFHAGIGEVEPLLQEAGAQQDGEANGLASIAGLGVERRNLRQ
jgi:hypothetical protein